MPSSSIAHEDSTSPADELMELGFDRDTVDQALAVAKGDQARASELLFDPERLQKLVEREIACSSVTVSPAATHTYPVGGATKHEGNIAASVRRVPEDLKKSDEATVNAVKFAETLPSNPKKASLMSSVKKVAIPPQPFFKMAQNLDLRCLLLPTKTRLGKNKTPVSFMVAFQVIKRASTMYRSATDPKHSHDYGQQQQQQQQQGHSAQDRKRSKVQDSRHALDGMFLFRNDSSMEDVSTAHTDLSHGQ